MTKADCWAVGVRPVAAQEGQIQGPRGTLSRAGSRQKVIANPGKGWIQGAVNIRLPPATMEACCTAKARAWTGSCCCIRVGEG
eukprot:jgi/Chrzof1/10781/Cz05g11280.t1